MSNENRVIAAGERERESRRKWVHGVAIRRVSLSIFMDAKPGRDGTDRTCYIKSKGLRISFDAAAPAAVRSFTSGSGEL